MKRGHASSKVVVSLKRNEHFQPDLEFVAAILARNVLTVIGQLAIALADVIVYLY